MALNRWLLVLMLLSTLASAQENDSIGAVNKKRLRLITIGGTIGYGVSLVGLSHLWYSDTESQSFRFFNDNAEWKQLDKVGHFFSAYYFSYGTSRALQWSNVDQRKANLIGSLVGFGVLLPIEILDGFSNAYGASVGDLAANAAGSAFFLVQSHVWGEPRIHPKFSFHRTRYAKMRSSLLGNDLSSEILKDYNGQTFWLSCDIDKFIQFPRWLNIAVGYGGEGMVHARDIQNVEAGYDMPYRQYYLSIDFDLTSIKSRSKVINTLLFVANMIKIPAPTLEFSHKGIIFHSLYF
jgi:uncharacterized protein YfiM (DUF2279 family)